MQPFVTESFVFYIVCSHMSLLKDQIIISQNTLCTELEPSPLLSLTGGLLLALFWLQDISCFFSLSSTWVISYTSEIHTFLEEAYHSVLYFLFQIVYCIFLLGIVTKALQITETVCQWKVSVIVVMHYRVLCCAFSLVFPLEA